MAALPHESVGSFSHKPLGLLEDSLRRGLRCFPIVQSGHDGLHGTADVGCATTAWRLNRAHHVVACCPLEINGGAVVGAQAVSGVSLADWRHPGSGLLSGPVVGCAAVYDGGGGEPRGARLTLSPTYVTNACEGRCRGEVAAL